MDDCLILGGGVIGLSLAYELARHGIQVRVIDRGEVGREASWAGAGILPPAKFESADHPYDQLRALSFQLHAEWSEQLRAESGIDNGYQRCGGLYLARHPGEAASLAAFAGLLKQLSIEVQQLTAMEVAELEPALQPFVASVHLCGTSIRLPEESQLRNPHHLQALELACRTRNVKFETQTAFESFDVRNGRIEQVKTDRGQFQATKYCICGGAWTHDLLKSLDISADIYPVRGQMVLFECERVPFTHVINEGPRYLVPRTDGHVLVGSTEEEAGFDKSTTNTAIQDLVQFAYKLVPVLCDARIEKTWAGLRPASFDGFPYLGRLPGITNGYVAAGHFRSGLFLSTGTAVLMSQLIRGFKPEIDLSPFSIGRG